MSDEVSKSWFCVFNNPAEHGYTGNPEEITEQIADKWIAEMPTRTCAVIYCISADGLHHIHAVLEDTKAMRFSSVKKQYPGMHIEPTKGNKEQAEDYIQKRGKWQEKGEQVLYITRRGEIKGAQGQRRDLDIIEELLGQGMTPNQIMEQSFSFRRYEKMIRTDFFARRSKVTPPKRIVTVYWHIGDSGSGKTHTYVKKCDELGEDDVYLLTDYSNGGFDFYCAQKILFLDEFRGQIPWSTLMNYLDGYKVQIHCRNVNAYALWNEVHIATILPPELVYKEMVEKNQSIDTFEQLRRRIDFIIYHWKDAFGEYHEYSLPMCKYDDYETLKRDGLKQYGQAYIELPESSNLPF